MTSTAPLRLSLHSQSSVLSLRWIRLFSSSEAENLFRELPTTQRRRRLDVALTGLPNAGKSQLLNILTKSTVSAVSRKRHTTRQGVLGERTVGNTQLLFMDTPGFMRRADAKKEGLPESGHLAELRTYLPSVDHTLLVVDAAKNLTDSVKETLVELMLMALQAQGRDELLAFESDDRSTSSSREGETVRSEKEVEAYERNSLLERKFSVVVNKVDLVHPKAKLLDVAMEVGNLAESVLERLQEGRSPPSAGIQDLLPMFFYTSALKQEGTDDLLYYLLDLSTPCDTWEIEPGQSTDMSPEERVQEVVREKIYRCLHKEVPYRIEQRNTLFRVVSPVDTRSPINASTDKSPSMGVVVHQELVARTKSHVELVRGSGGQTLERIRQSAQKDLERIFGCRVSLQLHIKYSKSKSR
jgi:GTP-binding protein Era